MKVYFTLLTLLTLLAVLLLFSNVVLAQMQLKLSNDNEKQSLSQVLESNSQLVLPSSVISPPPDAMELKKSLIMLGLLADLSIPMGSDSGFTHIAGTGFSGHVEFSYFVSPSFRLAFRGGYVNFGKQTSEDEFGTYEDTYSQIPLLIGGYYMIATASGFKPYVGLAIGAFFETYKVSWIDVGQTTPYLDNSFTSTGFGAVPAIGAYYIAGSVWVQLAVEYTYIFTDGPTATYDYSYYPLGKINGVAQSKETYEEPTDKASYFSVLLGVSFPVGK